MVRLPVVPEQNGDTGLYVGILLGCHILAAKRFALSSMRAGGLPRRPQQDRSRDPMRYHWWYRLCCPCGWAALLGNRWTKSHHRL